MENKKKIKISGAVTAIYLMSMPLLMTIIKDIIRPPFGLALSITLALGIVFPFGILLWYVTFGDED